jgi:hypothetical protein
MDRTRILRRALGLKFKRSETFGSTKNRLVQAGIGKHHEEGKQLMIKQKEGLWEERGDERHFVL